jgi:hypothetical protein
MTPLTDQQIFLIMVATLRLSWGIAEVVDIPWFRRFLVLFGLVGK